MRKVFCLLLFVCLASAATPTIDCEEFCEMTEQANGLHTINCTGQVNITNLGNTTLFDTYFTTADATFLDYNKSIIPSGTNFINYTLNKTGVSSVISDAGVYSNCFILDHENFSAITLLKTTLVKEERNQAYRAVVMLANPTDMSVNVTAFDLRRESASLLRFEPEKMAITNLAPSVPFTLGANSEYIGDVVETLGAEPIYVVKTLHEMLFTTTRETQNITNYTSYGGTLTPPTIAIESPGNSTYYTVAVDTNVTLSRAGDKCFYSLNGTANITMTNDTSTHFYNETTIPHNGNFNITFWCNDTYGNGASKTQYFTKGATPAAFTVTIESPANTTYYTSTMNLNITLSTAGENCFYSLNGTANMTMANSTSTTFYNQTTIPHNGHFNITFWCNNSDGDADSAIRYFTKAAVPTTPGPSGGGEVIRTVTKTVTITRGGGGGGGGGGRLKAQFNATKTVSDTIVQPGEFVTVTIELRNTGDAILRRILVLQPLPENIAYLGGNGVWDGKKVWFEIDRFEVGETIPLSITLQILGEVSEVPKTQIFRSDVEVMVLDAIPFGHEITAVKALLVKKRFHLLEDGRHEIEIRLDNTANKSTGDFSLVDFYSTPSISNIKPAPADRTENTITWNIKSIPPYKEAMVSYIVLEEPEYTYPQVFGLQTHLVEISVSFEEQFVQKAEWGGAMEGIITLVSLIIVVSAFYLMVKSREVYK